MPQVKAFAIEVLTKKLINNMVTSYILTFLIMEDLILKFLGRIMVLHLKK